MEIKKQTISMTQQLRKLVYEKGKEKLGEITGYYKYRIVAELKIIKEMNAEDVILCLERAVSIAQKINVPLEVDQQQVKSSFVCYLLGISKTDPIEAKLRFELPEDIGEIRIEQSLEDIYAIGREFSSEDEVLFFGRLVRYAPKKQPTENR